LYVVYSNRRVHYIQFDLCYYYPAIGSKFENCGSKITSLQFLKEKEIPDDSIDKIVPKEELSTSSQDRSNETPEGPEADILI
jgi:hypothetical protein